MRLSAGIAPAVTKATEQAREETGFREGKDFGVSAQHGLHNSRARTWTTHNKYTLHEQLLPPVYFFNSV